jgi:hypothetical protein
MNSRSQITIAKVWQPYNPGDKKGKVVDTAGNKWGVFADKLYLYEQGGTYEIEYDTWRNPKDGKDYHTILEVVPASGEPQQAAPRAAPAQAPKPNGHIAPRQRTDPTDAERMFVCANLVAFIKAGKCEPDLSTLVGDVNMLRDVWKNTFGADA